MSDGTRGPADRCGPRSDDGTRRHRVRHHRISPVMDPPLPRSVGVTSTLILPRTASAAAPALDFDALYRSARDDVYAYVATLLRDRAAAEDVTALAFERAYRKRRSFDPRRGAERAWLFGIARHAALDELRRRKR